MWNKNKVYGYSEEYIREHGEPEDNYTMIESHEGERLTKEEIDRMFPCQAVGLIDIDYTYDENTPEYFNSAVVKFYHCDSDEVYLMELKGEIEYAYMHFPSWMDGELLWF